MKRIYEDYERINFSNCGVGENNHNDICVVEIDNDPKQKVKERLCIKMRQVKKSNGRIGHRTGSRIQDEWHRIFGRLFEGRYLAEKRAGIKKMNIRQKLYKRWLKFSDYIIEGAEISEFNDGIVHNFEIEKGKSKWEFR